MLPTLSLAMAAVMATTIAQAMLKQGMDRVGGISAPGSDFLPSMKNALTDPFILGGFALIMIAVPAWLEVLARLPLSVAAPLVSFGYIVAVVIGALVFKETITPLKIIGIALIIVGVVAITQSR